MGPEDLKKWRAMRGAADGRRLSQADAAAHLGVHWSTYQRWESGKSKPEVGWSIVAMALAADIHNLPPFGGAKEG